MFVVNLATLSISGVTMQNGYLVCMDTTFLFPSPF
jgi:hypothetical protein